MELRPPVTLEGTWIRLVPLELAHADLLQGVCQDPEIWRWVRYGSLADPARRRTHFEELLRLQSQGEVLPFVVLWKPTGSPIGATQYLAISRPDRSVEVGGTWYGREFWRTPVNTEAKWLLLEHAFEHERAHRVQLKTDLGNLRSQAAIERLGAVREGVLREHLVLPDGRLRSSVIYSILATEWPRIKPRLAALRARPWAPPATV